MRNIKKTDTSWNKVSTWYDKLLNNDDSYQTKVITPNLLRFLNIRKGDNLYDLACGQGFFSNIFAHKGANVIASDLSKNLIEKAKINSKEKVIYYITPAHKAPFINDHTIDIIVIVLAIQNIENVNDVLVECKRILTQKGKIVFVLNHPTFRVPQGSDWHYFDNIQSRIVSRYLSESKILIDMTPGEKNHKKKIFTVSFHRSLQFFTKLFVKNNFAITKLEEWISHKQSEFGPRKIAEDNSRKEIPMFMCIEIKNI